MSDELLTTTDMLMALEEMPPYTAYGSVIGELGSYPAPITVYRRHDIRGAGYVVECERLSGVFPRVPECYPTREAFLLNLGYRGVTLEMVWRKEESR